MCVGVNSVVCILMSSVELPQHLTSIQISLLINIYKTDCFFFMSVYCISFCVCSAVNCFFFSSGGAQLLTIGGPSFFIH